MLYELYDICVQIYTLYTYTVERLRGPETTVSSTLQFPEFPDRSPATAIIRDEWNTDCRCEITSWYLSDFWSLTTSRSIYAHLYSFGITIIIVIIITVIIIIIHCHERLCVAVRIDFVVNSAKRGYRAAHVFHTNETTAHMSENRVFPRSIDKYFTWPPSF